MSRNFTQQLIVEFTSRMSVMYSHSVTANSRKEELQLCVSSKVRHWCSKFIWRCHSSNQPRQWKAGLAQWDGIIAWPEQPPLPYGVKAFLCRVGSQFTSAKEARQHSDKQFSLNKAFRHDGGATTIHLSCLWRPPLPLARLLPRQHLTHIHPSSVTDVRHSLRWACKGAKSVRAKVARIYTATARQREQKLSH